jgi:RimJ/RimL family protein N-acetyltransferase
VTTTQIKSPTDCSPAELDAFETLVREGGEVTPDGLRQRIYSASHLLFLYDSSGTLCGVSALKHPNDGYRSKVFRQARASAPPVSYPVELGWVYVPLSHQGQRLSRPLVEQLLPYAAGGLVYGTTRADNERMQRTLARYGFHQDGIAYRSARGDYDLVLFVQHTK